MHGKFLRKILPLAVSFSLLMGSAASVMAENTESVTDTVEEVTYMTDSDITFEEEAPESEVNAAVSFSDDVEIQETDDVQAEADVPAGTEDTAPEEETVIEAENKEERYSVFLLEAYPNVEVMISDKEELLPVETKEQIAEDAYEEIFNDEDLILVTVDQENGDHLVTAEELNSITDQDSGYDSIPLGDEAFHQEFSEGTTVYVSAIPEDGYSVDSIFAVGADGRFFEMDQEEDSGHYSFSMPDTDVDIFVMTEEKQEMVPGDFTETEIEALEQYVEEQGLPVSRGAMLLAAASSSVKTITFNMNGFISYSAEGYGTGMDAMFYINSANYKGNGNGYCLNPAVQAPGHASQGTSISYTTTVYDYTDPMLLKIMYYGFGGPVDITGSYASTPTARHILTHMVAVKRAKELGISGAGDYTYRANSTAIAKAEALYNAIKARADITGTVSILTPVAGQQTIMLLSSYAVPETKGKLTFSKSSAKLVLSEDNPNYSLEGAKYRVYADKELTVNKGSFTTDANGNCSTVLSLDPGTYYVKEVSVPKGYLLNETVYTVTVKAGQTSQVKASDMPANDPLSLLLEKVDAVTGKASSRLKGAEFTVKFYPVENEADIKTPKWTWVFATDENGRIRVDDAHKVSGDELVKDSATGATMIPLGFITIQETKAPSGYLINDTVYTCQIMKDTDAVRVTNLPVGENAVKEQPANTELSVSKKVTGSAGNKNEEFQFTLQLTNNNDPSIIIYEGLFYFVEEDGKEAVKRSVIAVDGKYSFTLHHGQTVTFKDIPIGATYTVYENDGESKGYTVTNKKVTGITTKDPVHIEVINNKEMTIPTGADTNRNALLIMTAACMALLVVFYGKRLFRKQ